MKTPENFFQIIQTSTDQMKTFKDQVDDLLHQGWLVTNVETVTDSTGKMFFVAYMVWGFGK